MGQPDSAGRRRAGIRNHPATGSLPVGNAPVRTPATLAHTEERQGRSTPSHMALVRGNEHLTEESLPGSDFLASVCREWETEALAAADASRVVLLRSAPVLESTGGMLPRMALPLRLFIGGPVGAGTQYWSWIHRDDWVAMAIWASATSRVSGPLNLAAPAPVTNREFAQTLGHVLKRPAFMPAPAFALRLFLGEMADAVLFSHRVIPAKAEAPGFRFRYATLEPALVAALP